MQSGRHGLRLGDGRHPLGGDHDAPLLLRLLQGDRERLGEELLNGERGPLRADHVPLEGGGQERVAHHGRGAAVAQGAGRRGRVGQVVADAVAAGDHLVGAGRGRDRHDGGVDGSLDGPGEVGGGLHVEDGLDRHPGEGGGRLEVAQGAGNVLAVVGQGGEVGVGEGEGDDLAPLHRLLQLAQPPFGELLVRAGDVQGAVLDAVAVRHGVDGGQEVRVDHPGDRQVPAQRDHLVEPSARPQLRHQGVVLEDRGPLVVRGGLRRDVGRGDQRPEVGELGLLLGGLGLVRQEGPLDAEHPGVGAVRGLAGEGDAELVDARLVEPEVGDRDGEGEVRAEAGAQLGDLRGGAVLHGSGVAVVPVARAPRRLLDLAAAAHPWPDPQLDGRVGDGLLAPVGHRALDGDGVALGGRTRGQGVDRHIDGLRSGGVLGGGRRGSGDRGGGGDRGLEQPGEERRPDGDGECAPQPSAGR